MDSWNERDEETAVVDLGEKLKRKLGESRHVEDMEVVLTQT